MKRREAKTESAVGLCAAVDLLFGGLFVYLIGSLCVFVLAVWLCASLTVL